MLLIVYSNNAQVQSELPLSRERLVPVALDAIPHKARIAHVVGRRVQDGPLAIA